MTQEIISVRSIKKHFKDVKAVDGIDLNIKEGEFVALLGPNGAGKTTLVEMIEGIQKPDSGEILITGKPWSGNNKELNQILGISLQETRFVDKLRVIETLRLFASFFNLDNNRVEEILKLVNLDHKRKSFVVNLSGGQKQKLALGIAIINNPRVLLLDEPTTGLDPTARREIWNILNKLKKEMQTSLILTTHYMEEAEYLCDRIIIVDQGKILAQGTLEELLTSNKSCEIIEFTLSNATDANLLDSKIDKYKIKWNDNQSKGRLKVPDIVEFMPVMLEFFKSKNIAIKSLESRKMTLDDLFISMTGRQLHS